MKTKIAIVEAEFFAFHGYYEEERRAGHTFIIDAEVTMEQDMELDEDISATVNYEMLYQICKEEMGHTRQLMETVVKSILTRFHKECIGIESAKVRISKLGPQLGGKVAKAVVEMEL